jgi:hypothetical protein
VTDTSVVNQPELLRYHGRVVPWVTRWTDEVRRHQVRFKRTRSGDLVVSYADGFPEERDPNGFLWQREGIKRGGEPEFAMVSTYRQRRAMRKGVCQVCGRRIDKRPIQWLVPESLFDYTQQGEAVTLSAPTCSDCIPIALELCPHLKRNQLLLAKVLEYQVWGVSGEAVSLDPAGEVRRHRSIMYPYGGRVVGIAPTAVMAKQQAVEFTKFTIERLEGK